MRPPFAVSRADTSAASFLFCPVGSLKKCNRQFAPAAANASRIDAPIPRELPVTSTVLPLKSNLIMGEFREASVGWVEQAQRAKLTTPHALVGFARSAGSTHPTGCLLV